MVGRGFKGLNEMSQQKLNRQQNTVMKHLHLIVIYASIRIFHDSFTVMWSGVGEVAIKSDSVTVLHYMAQR